ncbi:unnamed protein product [Brassicogethes aeneus]|uniref:Tudor domain-containing protein n=1 Tax=Brassicogethes aeneus TaxID=1431903 RepID=A0A9P0BIH7_BRAAE|nr:unnamed protein product [Brassicogethes aeneus]
MKPLIRTVALTVGFTIFGLSSYLFYLVFLKDEDDDYEQTVSKASNFKTHEVKVPRDQVKVLIGRNGQNIKRIQDQSSTRINFKDREGFDDKICIIRGSLESCNVAENLIRDFIKSQPVMDCEDIWVPISSVGKIIGRCGDKIVEIRSQSGAKINVVDEDKDLKNKQITIKGTKEQILVAKSLIEDIVEHTIEMQTKMNNILAKREPRGPSRVAHNSNSTEAPKKEKLPETQPNTQFEVYVSAVKDPSQFWVQIVGPKASELDMLVEEMTEYYNKEENRNLHLLDEIKAGDLVAGIFQYDNKWYRAEVISVDDKTKSADLYYVDYGDTDTVDSKEIYELRTDFLSLNFQAIQCHLSRVAPVGENWSLEAIDKFEEWTHTAQWKKLSARISGYTSTEKSRNKRSSSPIPSVEIFNVNDGTDMNVGEELIKNGYAVLKPEADSHNLTKEPQFQNELFTQSAKTSWV